MDANGQRFWMLADEAHWALTGDPPGLGWDRARRALRLAGRRALAAAEDAAVAAARVEEVPIAVDALGTRAAWDAAARQVVARSHLPGERVLHTAAAGSTVTDLVVGHDGVLYLALDGGVTLLDLRERFDPVAVSRAGLAAWRLAPHPEGGVYALDRGARALARLVGAPAPRRPHGAYAPGVFRPEPEDPRPPALVPLAGAILPDDEVPVALASSPAGRLAVLTWTAAGPSRLRLLRGDGAWSAPLDLLDATRPYSLAWAAEDRVASLVVGAQEAAVWLLPDAPPDAPASLRTAGDVYPLRDHGGGPLAHTPSPPAQYPTADGALSGLYRLSLPSRSAAGEALGAAPFDSGDPTTVWHRIYIEADLPPGTGILLSLAASDDAVPPADPAAWWPHAFGGAGALLDERAPRGVWVRQPSELPFHAGLLACRPAPGRAGLFTALVQRTGRRVTALRGRFLWVRATLVGDGRATPELAAVRVYGPRFSYVERYLPEVYRESLFPPEADEPAARSSPSDFLTRFLGNVEGILTPLEDRIANAHLLTDPDTAPEESLEWLARWIGFAFSPAHPVARRRALLAAAPELSRRRGTLPGVALALELTTDGGVSRGDLVIVEDFRLRRTFATLLGVDLTDEADPLTGGISFTGSSFVGDSLILGEESRRELLALFDADGRLDRRDEERVAAFFERLAFRVTVLVHRELGDELFRLVERVLSLEAPAHIEARAVVAPHPFVVGLASLVGVDSYLRRKPRPGPVQIDRSRIGERDVVQRPPSLDPRLEGGLS
ncbi:phage tail protein [Sorangium sp. So ce1024]|uniref:phage tail protein n=1 Tax=Sorangium sp. So ce1024 TaxID=3133327 RepID=UPI003F11B645